MTAAELSKRLKVRHRPGIGFVLHPIDSDYRIIHSNSAGVVHDGHPRKCTSARCRAAWEAYRNRQAEP